MEVFARTEAMRGKPRPMRLRSPMMAPELSLPTASETGPAASASERTWRSTETTPSDSKRRSSSRAPSFTISLWISAEISFACFEHSQMTSAGAPGRTNMPRVGMSCLKGAVRSLTFSRISMASTIIGTPAFRMATGDCDSAVSCASEGNATRMAPPRWGSSGRPPDAPEKPPCEEGRRLPTSHREERRSDPGPSSPEAAPAKERRMGARPPMTVSGGHSAVKGCRATVP
mmetsp:Transcript_94383/g.266628  ORF Transcript_94383/g.266628 Transcript_94383/m.266628 type:complete len:230 (-) Transcript_94383:126-815(-)